MTYVGQHSSSQKVGEYRPSLCWRSVINHLQTCKASYLCSLLVTVSHEQWSRRRQRCSPVTPRRVLPHTPETYNSMSSPFLPELSWSQRCCDHRIYYHRLPHLYHYRLPPIICHLPSRTVIMQLSSYPIISVMIVYSVFIRYSPWVGG